MGGTRPVGWLVTAALAALASLATGCSAPPPLHDGLGAPVRAVSTGSALAQAYFDQGLALCWGFNHDEALRAFDEMARLDPGCAMAHWGRAYALGPTINRPLEPGPRSRRAYEAAQRALWLSDGSTQLERALIEAMAIRFAHPAPDDRGELDRAYAAAMRAAWRRFGHEPLVGVLFADALMNVSADWRAWGRDDERGEHTPEIIATLEAVLAAAPDDAGANHFYIHAVESSDRPERALPSAERLEGLMPAAAHMVHMPSHIYIRLGMYDAAVESNTRAAERDDRFFAQAPRQGVYHLSRAHNRHFLAWAATFRGSYGDAIDAARAMEARLPAGRDEQFPALEAYRFVPMHVQMRFGRWDDMLAEPPPPEGLPVARALWHQGRAVACANTGRLAQAREEAARFESAARRIPDRARVRRAPVADLLAVARQMMWGEILFAEGDREGAFAALRRGVEIEDALPYAEPPSWMQPVRHSLGALLLEDGQLAEAEAVYRADLEHHADNVWSLHGLAECLRRTGRDDEARAVQARFDEVAAHADVEISASCFCRRAAASRTS